MSFGLAWFGRPSWRYVAPFGVFLFFLMPTAVFGWVAYQALSEEVTRAARQVAVDGDPAGGGVVDGGDAAGGVAFVAGGDRSEAGHLDGDERDVARGVVAPAQGVGVGGLGDQVVVGVPSAADRQLAVAVDAHDAAEEVALEGRLGSVGALGGEPVGIVPPPPVPGPVGVDPADVDYLAFDHLHTQDVRRLVGTRGPAPDLGSADEAIAAWFPNARLVTHVREWEAIRHLHPVQVPWYQPRTYEDLPPERLLLVDGDVLPFGAFTLRVLATPGHTPEHVAFLVSDLRRTDDPQYLFSGGALLLLSALSVSPIQVLALAGRRRILVARTR